jgi:hypothetical protein
MTYDPVPTTPIYQRDLSEDDMKNNNHETNLTFATRVSTHKNAPARRGKWQFVEGTDLSDAKLSQPDPSKFFLIRQIIDNHEQKDCRQYPRWETFDWNDPEHITHLNNARRQIRARTSGIIAKPRPVWTLLEKEKLKELISEAIDTRPAGGKIDWANIASKMQAYFEGKTQKAGEDLAPPCSKMVDGKEVISKKKMLKLKADRIGFSRNASAINTQAHKYGDIVALLQGDQEGPKTKKHGLDNSSKDKNEDDGQLDDEIEKDKSAMPHADEGLKDDAKPPHKRLRLLTTKSE